MLALLLAVTVTSAMVMPGLCPTLKEKDEFDLNRVWMLYWSSVLSARCSVCISAVELNGLAVGLLLKKSIPRAKCRGPTTQRETRKDRLRTSLCFVPCALRLSLRPSLPVVVCSSRKAYIC